MSAGRGIWHSEKNWSATDEVHFIQMWVLPDTEAVDPGYQQLDINDQLAGEVWCRSRRVRATMQRSRSNSVMPCSGVAG